MDFCFIESVLVLTSLCQQSKFLRIMAFCLNACFNQVVRHDGIQVFSRLGGKYLGNIDMCNTTLSAFQKVRFLQQQASSLCPHPKRTCEDLLLYVGQEQVGPPGMAYMDDLNEEASLQVQTLLKRCTRLEMMWDEDDAYAKSKVEQAGIRVEEFGCFLDIGLNGTDFPKELGYLGKKGNSRWHITRHTGAIRVDFSVFKMRNAISSSGFIHPLEVKFLSLYNITPTNYMHCNVKHLCVIALDIDCNNFAGLDQLETLCLDGCHVVRNLKALAELPKLKDIILDFESMTLQGASEALDAMECMPNVVVKHRVGDRFCDARNTLPNILHVKRMLATRRLVVGVGFMALGMALVTGVAALYTWWPKLKDRLG
jgi:hypothetical protein